MCTNFSHVVSQIEFIIIYFTPVLHYLSNACIKFRYSLNQGVGHQSYVALVQFMYVFTFSYRVYIYTLLWKS